MLYGVIPGCSCPFCMLVRRTTHRHTHTLTAHLHAHAHAHTSTVYHVTEKGWTKVRGDDVTELHFQYYPQPELHPSNGDAVL